MSLSDDLKSTDPDTPDLTVGHAITPATHNEDSEGWHAYRRRGIGGSDVAKIMGQQPYGETRVDLWRQKTGREESKVGNAAVRFGSLIEPYIRRWLVERADDTSAIYGQFSDLVDYPASLHHPDHPWARGHVDGALARGGEAYAGVEVKNSSTPHGDDKRGWIDGVMEYHYPQMQHYMWVTGLPRWWYVYYEPPAEREFIRLVAEHDATEGLDDWQVDNPDRFLLWVVDLGEVTIREVERDDSYIERMARAEHDFWHNHVDPDVEPDEWLPDGEVRVDAPDLADMLDEYAHAHARGDEATKDRLKPKIKARASAIATDQDIDPKKIWVNGDDYVLWHGGYNDWQAKPAEREGVAPGKSREPSTEDINLGF